MINEIFNLVGKYAGDVITNNPDVPDTQKELAISATTDAIKDGIKGYLNPSNIGALASMLSGGNKGSSESNSIVETLSKSVVSSLMGKAGLSSVVSSGIASTLIPMVINVISQKISDPKDSSFSVQSLIDTFTKSGNGKGGGILGALGGLFNK